MRVFTTNTMGPSHSRSYLDHLPHSFRLPCSTGIATSFMRFLQLGQASTSTLARHLTRYHAPMGLCWARALGSCTEKMSGEHLVSESVYGEGAMVTVQGFPWCRDEPRRVGIAALTSKILCTHHNSQLSEVDAAAGTAFEVWRDIDRIEAERNKLPPRRWNVLCREIDFDLLERWCVKTAINMANVNKPALRWHPGKEPIDSPPIEIVRGAFGLAALPPHMGLYKAAHVGRKGNLGTDTFTLICINWDGTGFAGAAITLWDLPFVLSLHDDPMPPNPPFLRRLPEAWHGATVDLGPEKIRIVNRGHLSQVVRLRRCSR